MRKVDSKTNTKYKNKETTRRLARIKDRAKKRANTIKSHKAYNQRK